MLGNRTYRELAKEHGVSRTTINHWVMEFEGREQARRPPVKALPLPAMQAEENKEKLPKEVQEPDKGTCTGSPKCNVGKQYNGGGQYDIEHAVIHPVTGKKTTVRSKGRAWFNDEGKAYRFKVQYSTLQKKQRHGNRSWKERAVSGAWRRPPTISVTDGSRSGGLTSTMRGPNLRDVI